MTNLHTLEKLSQTFKHHDLEITRTFVPIGDHPNVMKEFYTSTKMGNFDIEHRWVIRAGLKTFMGLTFDEAAKKALGEL